VGGYLYYTRHLAPAEATEEPALQTTTARKGDIVITAVGSGAARRDILQDTVIELLGQRVQE
jgi:hypothetical protein